MRVRGGGSRVAPTQGQEQVLAPPVDGLHRAAGEPQDKIFQGGRPDGLGPADIGAGEGASGQPRLNEIAPGVFDLG